MSSFQFPAGRPPFVIVEHTADWSIRVHAATTAELFTHAALGMAYLLAGDLTTVPLTHTADITLEADDNVDLLVAWLTELAYYAERDGTVFSQIDELIITPTSLQAKVSGGPAVEMLKHIKAVTYHNLVITEMDDGLETAIVFDV